MNKIVYNTLAIVMLTLAGGTLALAQRGTDYSFYDQIIDVKTLLEDYYVEDIDEEALRLGAINGMIEAVGDPYTQYVPPRDRSEFNKQMLGQYVGIGAQITVRDGWLTIVSPLEGTPAFKAGLMADDRITHIDGESTFERSSDESIARLTGEPGTTVVLTVERDGETLDVDITRAQIQTRSVKGLHFESSSDSWDYFLDPGRRIAYVRITQFTPGVTEEFLGVMEEVGAPEGELGGLVLDLRWNPGGVLEDAIEIADLLLDDGEIVSTRGRAHRSESRSATERGTLPDFPVAVLLNEQSASASEVLAGALSDHDRALIVGTRSFGKGSVQTVRALTRGRGAQLKITEQGYYLPSGRSIQRRDSSPVWGVDPSAGYYVPVTDEQELQMRRARQQAELIRSDENGGDWADPAWIQEQLADPQLAAATEAIQKRIDTGEWVATGATGVEGEEIVTEELHALRLQRERLLRQITRIDRRVLDLQFAAGDADDGRPAIDLWPDEIELEGGRVRVFGPDGAEVATLKITGENLERWLIDAGVESADEDDAN